MAKIATLLGLPKESTYKLERYEFVFLTGGPDAYGSCALKVSKPPGYPLWPDFLHNWERRNQVLLDAARDTQYHLIDWMIEATDPVAERELFVRQVNVTRSWNDMGSIRVWRQASDCVAFVDDTDSNTLYVSIDGWAMRTDASISLPCP